MLLLRVVLVAFACLFVLEGGLGVWCYCRKFVRCNALVLCCCDCCVFFVYACVLLCVRRGVVFFSFVMCLVCVLF